MVDEVRLNELIAQLNTALGDVTPYKLAVVPPGSLKPLEKNAHYLPKRIYDQLIANIQTDGNLSSVPFCWRQPDGTYEVLSGNHRVAAAVAANTPLIMVLYTDADLSRPERVAIQLSHNALVGKDNPALLTELWMELDALPLKIYSGLDDEFLATLQPVTLAHINEAALRFEELTLLFLPAEIERITEIVKRLGAAKHPRLLAPLEQFDRFFETLLSYKDAANILNSGTALLAMCDIVDDWLMTHKDGTRENLDAA